MHKTLYLQWFSEDVYHEKMERETGIEPATFSLGS
jgi:hypothetical protein